MKNTRYIRNVLFKIFFVFILAVVLFFVGLVIGYGIIGDGHPLEVLNPAIWHHIFDFLK
ncbi:DNA-directed RNA polymerase subunit beta [Enterococcus cecorum]|uniref:DNA-directed RNA polymerase subunit beta n=1 Tax=Enterococcus cecorum TaxID=44008 RepID=UPI001FABF78F|nr:DNA-directed RNA polymerase subunit beta [Enterococcus cecorum]MCJ0537258.1 DNA-directed RNA polymerase subunit beta [Enterococcus cecorum]MCJ0545057.1 DNA-directed RNA polymerase subunit beta [Enterococcus cecorum]MCJ0550454.1 DNA-directed RNA polymerase subunit beta [Enterococcus cecorum]MCJ0568090.1 DNA-directed RNA polymerase subunit beta [Enterococcus cecorum]MCJ0601946.1 DNA-directed RNA polymerase subunit beta [Enterococcus cecorum]